jgi:hypothetical protein
MNAVLASPHLAVPLASRSAVDALNRACFCISLDQNKLERALESELGQPGLWAMVRERCPYLFAAQPVFVAATQLERMAQVMQAIELVAALPNYQEQVLDIAPAIARLGHNGPLGAFFGYDFHLNQGHLGLIEINTNAGGAMLNAVLARAQRACCTAMQVMEPTLESVTAFERHIVDMFRNEWRLAGRARPLATIAIVDETPETQYLYPEFLLFQQLFERHGLHAIIASPTSLEFRDGVLWHGDSAIDLVYNRLTDFYLEQAGSAVLREAYLQQSIVLTPHPRAHALYADKRRLVLLSDARQLQALGVAQSIQDLLLEHVPHTGVVNVADEQRLWDGRRSLFFKPVAGFGSRAAYRGDKLTRRVWQDILAGDYVAQAIVAPGERQVDAHDASKTLKFDLRAYAYDGVVQWVAARMYQGQTTNFRTPGGGFAPVYSTADASGRTCHSSGEECAQDAGHASYVFLLDSASGVHPVPHALYVALAQGHALAPLLADQTLRLADWYVQLKAGEPDTVVNETYTLVHFDSQGRVDGSNEPVTDKAVGWPSIAERAKMHALLFAPAIQ